MQLSLSARTWWATTLMVFASGVASTAHAQASESREREALRRAQQLVQRLQTEKADAERARDDAATKLAQLTQQLEALKKENAEHAKQASALKRDAASATASAHSLEDKLGEATRLAAAQAEARHGLEQSTREKEQAWAAEQQTLQASLSREATRVNECEAKNAKLAGIARELMDRYARKGVWGALVEAEPFTGVAKVETENLLQAYQQRVDEQRIAPASSSR